MSFFAAIAICEQRGHSWNWNLFLDNDIFSHLLRSKRCVCLIGNPVEIGSGPAAVTPPFSNKEKEPAQPWVSLFCRNEMGRPLNGWGSQKTCLANTELDFCVGTGSVYRRQGLRKLGAALQAIMVWRAFFWFNLQKKTELITLRLGKGVKLK